MFHYNIERSFSWQPAVTKKTARVIKTFGLDLQRLKHRTVLNGCSLSLKPGDICFITGPSGAGKSVMLTEMYGATLDSKRLNIDEIPLERGKTVIDCIEAEFFESLRILSKAGLSDVFAVLNTPADLSEGQQYRYKLARALLSDRQIVFADEFCSNLDRISAAVIAHNIRKIAGRSQKIFVLASSHDDLLTDLLPDVIVIRHLNSSAELIYRNKKARGL